MAAPAGMRPGFWLWSGRKASEQGVQLSVGAAQVGEAVRFESGRRRRNSTGQQCQQRAEIDVSFAERQVGIAGSGVVMQVEMKKPGRDRPEPDLQRFPAEQVPVSHIEAMSQTRGIDLVNQLHQGFRCRLVNILHRNQAAAVLVFLKEFSEKVTGSGQPEVFHVGIAPGIETGMHNNEAGIEPGGNVKRLYQPLQGHLPDQRIESPGVQIEKRRMNGRPETGLPALPADLSSRFGTQRVQVVGLQGKFRRQSETQNGGKKAGTFRPGDVSS